MALPTLDATFASAADLPRRQMLARWLVEELGETQAPSDVLVSGAGSSAVNGTYTFAGEQNGKASWSFGDSEIAWDERWNINFESEGNIYYSDEDTEFPWQVTTWEIQNGEIPIPTVTEIPQPSPLSNYYSLPERYLWAKIAVAAGAPRGEAAYTSLPKNYVWSDIYNAVAGSSGNHTDWSENVALGHIAAAYRGDTGNPANLATYIDWPWRYKVSSIIDGVIDNDVESFISLSGATDRDNLNAFVKGIKALGLWNSMVCWPLRSSQNVGTGTTVYSLGGLGAFNGTLVNGPPWEADGIDFSNTINRRMQTSFSFLQPATIFSVFARSSGGFIQRIYGPSSDTSLLRSGIGAITANAGNSVFIGTIPSGNAAKFYTSQVEFNGANSTSSFNESSKTQIDLGLNNNSGFIIGGPDGSRGALTSFVGVFSTTSMDLIHNLYLETLGEGLPLP